MDTQAIAARLKAIKMHLGAGNYNSDHYDGNDDVRFLLAHLETLTQQVADEREAARTLSNQLEKRASGKDDYSRGIEHRAEQAEQQRDAAHAALKEIVRLYNVSHDDEAVRVVGQCYDLAAAALAASAPQKE